jgi:glutamine synthetase
MEVLEREAEKLGLHALLHEKPFAGVNGSGKHVNWSIGNSTQGNLLDPGSTPHENMQFLLFCGAVIRGVHQYGPLMRAAIATASNDHRLGANEAPPAIISVYLGSQLEDVFNQIKGGQLKSSATGGMMRLGIDSLPEFPKDAGDRNRTSPFAFTGNRFEFRAVGSGQSVAGPLVVLNTVLADSLAWIADQLEARTAKGESVEKASMAVLQQITQENGNVIFGGDGYSSEWHELAVKERGLENLRTTADALPVLQRPAIRDLFSRHNVLSPVELESRYEVYAEQYCLAIEVEARLAVRIARTQLYPAVSAYLGELAGSLQEQEAIGLNPSKALAQQIAGLNQQLLDRAAALETALGNAPHGAEAHMRHCADQLMVRMGELREAADALEGLVDDTAWPLPTYQEMLFVR